MRKQKPFIIYFFRALFVLCLSNYLTADVYIIKNDRHVVSFKELGKKIIINMESISDFTNDIDGEYPDVDFVGFDVDYNRNGVVDKKIDRHYGSSYGGWHYFYWDSFGGGPCGSLKTKAKVRVAFLKTQHSFYPHPVYIFTIPKKELSKGNVANLVFHFYEAGSGKTSYPNPKRLRTKGGLEQIADFSSTLEVNVKDIGQSVPFQKKDTKAPEIIIIEPKIKRRVKIISKSKSIYIRGRAIDESGIYEIPLNEKEAKVTKYGDFWGEVKLAYGNNIIYIKATDINGNSTEEKFSVERATETPKIIIPQQVKTDSITDLGNGRYFALMIAVQNYQDREINDLKYPIADANSLKEILENNYGFKKSNISILKDPDRTKIIEEFERLSKLITEKDNLIIFYAGHGYWDKQFQQGYWLASNAKKSNRSDWLSNSTIRDFIRGIKSKHTLLISDACFSGSLFTTRKAFSSATTAVQSLYKLPSRKAITSGTFTEVPDKSVFMKFFIKRLEQNREPFLSSENLFVSFKEAVINNSPSTQIPQYGIIRESGDEGGDFIFILKKSEKP